MEIVVITMGNFKIVISATNLQSFQLQFLIFKEWEVLHILIKHIIWAIFTIFYETIWHIDILLILLRYVDTTRTMATRDTLSVGHIEFTSWVKADWFIASHYFWTTAHPPEWFTLYISIMVKTNQLQSSIPLSFDCNRILNWVDWFLHSDPMELNSRWKLGHCYNLRNKWKLHITSILYAVDVYYYNHCPYNVIVTYCFCSSLIWTQ